MKRGAAKKTHHSHTGVRWPVCPERFPHPTGRVLFARSLAVHTDRRCRRHYHHRRLAHLQTWAGHGKMVERERSGR